MSVVQIFMIIIFMDMFYDDDDVTSLQATKACPNYEAVCARTGPLLLQSGSNLGQGPTQPYIPGAQPAFI